MRPEEADIATENVSDQYNSSNSTDSSNRIVVTELKRKLCLSVVSTHFYEKVYSSVHEPWQSSSHCRCS